MLDGSFLYPSAQLPSVGDVIRVADAAGNSVEARVDGVEMGKSRPIRALDLQQRSGIADLRAAPAPTLQARDNTLDYERLRTGRARAPIDGSEGRARPASEKLPGTDEEYV